MRRGPSLEPKRKPGASYGKETRNGGSCNVSACDGPRGHTHVQHRRSVMLALRRIFLVTSQARLKAVCFVESQGGHLGSRGGPCPPPPPPPPPPRLNATLTTYITLTGVKGGEDRRGTESSPSSQHGAGRGTSHPRDQLSPLGHRKRCQCY